MSTRCNTCKSGSRCSCNSNRSVVRGNTAAQQIIVPVPGVQGPPGPPGSAGQPGDTYVPIFDNDFFTI